MPRLPTLALLAALPLAACGETSPFLATAAAPPAAQHLPPAPGSRCLSVVAWNDLHGQIFADDPLLDTGRIPAGGVVALADQLTTIRATGDAVVVLDAGDLFTGPLASTLAEGAPVIEAYKLLGVDAVAIGNHDFDFGPTGDRVTAPAGVGDEAGDAGPRGALLRRMSEATFPFLSANVHKKGGAAPAWPRLQPSAIVERGGFRVGVVGYTTRDTPATTLRPNVADLDFATGAAASVAGAIRDLRAAHAAPVVLVAHASIDGPLPQDLGDTAAHRGELAALVHDLGADRPDVIVAGHRHAWMIGRIEGVPVVSSDQHGVGLARVRFCGAPPALEGVERRVALASSPPASELGARVAAAMAPWLEKVRALADEPVATLPHECEPKGPLGTTFADQVARATVENLADAVSPSSGVPVVGFTNIGSLRAAVGPGVLRYRDVFTAIPFENTVAVCGTNRAGLLRFVQNGLKKESAHERFPFGVWGAKIKVKRAADGSLSLGSVEIDGAPKAGRDDAPVWLAVSDFVLGGGDDLLAGVPCAPAATSQTRIREAWRKVVAREGACDGPSRNVVLE